MLYVVVVVVVVVVFVVVVNINNKMRSVYITLITDKQHYTGLHVHPRTLYISHCTVYIANDS